MPQTYTSGTPDLPVLDRAHLEALEAIFPPKCFEGGNDVSVQMHMKYAGKVDLIQRLRARFEETAKQGEKDDDQFDHRDGERAGQ